MKIDKVIMACDNNPLFYEFWKPLAELWINKFYINPVLVFCSDLDNSEDINALDNLYNSGYKTQILSMPLVNNIPSYIHAVWGRFWATHLFPDDVCMVVDMDMAPLSPKYFIDDISKIDSNVYLHLNDTIYHHSQTNYNTGQKLVIDPHEWQHNHQINLAACYHIAKGSLYQKVYNFLDWEAEMIKLNNMKFDVPFAVLPNMPKFAIDEIYSTQMLRKSINDIVFYTYNKNYNAPNVDRSNWQYDPELVKQGYYMDSHLLRPYSQYKQEIDKLLDLVPTYEGSSV